ncbi:unnamed protein product, partial [Allacma fusca]
MSGQV